MIVKGHTIDGLRGLVVVAPVAARLGGGHRGGWKEVVFAGMFEVGSSMMEAQKLSNPVGGRRRDGEGETGGSSAVTRRWRR